MYILLSSLLLVLLNELRFLSKKTLFRLLEVFLVIFYPSQLYKVCASERSGLLMARELKHIYTKLNFFLISSFCSQTVFSHDFAIDRLCLFLIF